jgi:uncharacterized protein (DUF1499 family)
MDRMRRIVLPLVLVAGAVTVAGAGYVRLAPIEPAEWHADPETAPSTGRPNEWRAAEGGDVPPLRLDAPPRAVAAAFDAVALGEPGVTRLAGDPEEGHATYVARSRFVGFPDLVSMRAVAEGEGTRLSVWSRSRWGYSDMGVNRARLEDWLDRVPAAMQAN